MFVILEIQEATEGATPAMLTSTAETKDAALSKWHDILRFAAVSSLYRHTAIVMQTDGKYLARESYIHEPEPEEPDEEVTA